MEGGGVARPANHGIGSGSDADMAAAELGTAIGRGDVRVVVAALVAMVPVAVRVIAPRVGARTAPRAFLLAWLDVSSSVQCTKLLDSAGANCGSRGSFSVAHGVDGFSPRNGLPGGAASAYVVSSSVLRGLLLRERAKTTTQIGWWPVGARRDVVCDVHR